jgi:hypothetical protein
MLTQPENVAISLLVHKQVLLSLLKSDCVFLNERTTAYAIKGIYQKSTGRLGELRNFDLYCWSVRNLNTSLASEGTVFQPNNPRIPNLR